jgi:hypothetical protein
VLGYVSSPLYSMLSTFLSGHGTAPISRCLHKHGYYIACAEWKIKVGRAADELHARTTHCQLMRGRTASDNAIASIKNKRALRRVFHFYYDKLSFEGRLPAINIRSLLNQRILTRSNPYLMSVIFRNFIRDSIFWSYNLSWSCIVSRFIASLESCFSIWISIIYF